MKAMDPKTTKKILSELYANTSKHSSYQNVPDFVADAIDFRVEIREDWRGDRVRLDYIESVPLLSAGNNWCDFGANTGYFSLTIAHRHPERKVLAIEANPEHISFIETVTQCFAMENVSVIGEPITIETLSQVPKQDVMLHLNVLHHAGADFDQGKVNGREDFLHYAVEYLRRLQECTDMLVFQLGSNLWGDKTKPIIGSNDDAAKLILFSDLLVRANWKIDHIAYAAKAGNSVIEYRAVKFGLVSALSDLPTGVPATRIEKALHEFDLGSHIGEFYRRPLFICSSRK